MKLILPLIRNPESATEPPTGSELGEANPQYKNPNPSFTITL
jgi:hypothetical protein